MAISFSFARPLYLVFLAAIPLLILIHFAALKRKRSNALKFANFNAIAKIKGIDLISKNISILVLTVIICVLLVLSISGLTMHRQLEASSFSFIIAIDSSSSMEANDFEPTRLDAAKETASFFVDTLPTGSRVGVISFSGNAVIESELTEDLILAKQAIQRITLSSVGGTDLYEAVLTSSNLLEGEEAKAVILLSDGRINVGTIEDVILYAAQHDITVHTIGIGTLEGGETRFAMSKLDEDSLTAIAYNTGARYFPVQTNEQLQNSFNEIFDLKLKRASLDLSYYLVIISLVLLLLEYALINTKYKTLP